MKIILESFTDNPIQTIARAASICYGYDPFVVKELPEEEACSLVRKTIKRGHMSCVEHVSLTFLLSGVSRALTHQLVRHRLASYSQKSQRWVKENGFGYVTPQSIKNESIALAIFTNAMGFLANVYKTLIKMEIRKEDARYVLPNACESTIAVTMNVRELLHFFSLRTCNRAQWEIRDAAEKMLVLAREAIPILFENAGPPCVALGFCPEEEESCGHSRASDTIFLKKV
jgi:thymidylate synthase (FAD)